MIRWLIALVFVMACTGCASMQEMCAETDLKVSLQPSEPVATLFGIPKLEYWDTAGRGGWIPAWRGIKTYEGDDDVRCQFIPHCVPIRIIVTLDPNVPNARREIYNNFDGDLDFSIRNRRTGARHKLRIEMEYQGGRKPWVGWYSVYMAPRSRW